MKPEITTVLVLYLYYLFHSHANWQIHYIYLVYSNKLKTAKCSRQNIQLQNHFCLAKPIIWQLSRWIHCQKSLLSNSNTYICFVLLSSPLPKPKSKVLNPKSKVQRKGTGTATMIQQATHPNPHITFLTCNVNLVMIKCLYQDHSNASPN